MVPSSRVCGAAFCLFLLVVVGCGGHEAASSTSSGQRIYVTAGGGSSSGSVGSTGATAGSGGTSSGDSATTAGETTGTTAGETTGGAYVPPTLGDADTDLAFASDGAALRFATMAGTGDAPGFVDLSYDYDERSGDGSLLFTGYLEGADGRWQEIQCEFDHSTFVKVGTKLKMTYGVYYEHRGEGDYAGWEGIVGTTAEVAAVGPGLSVTVKLNGLKFRSLDDEKSVLTVSGTLRSPVNPPTASSTLGDGGTTGTSSGTTGTTSGGVPALRTRILRRLR